jgi:hypothetical protein
VVAEASKDPLTHPDVKAGLANLSISNTAPSKSGKGTPAAGEAPKPAEKPATKG